MRTNILGGNNIYVGVLFIVTGSLSGAVALLYLSKHLFEKYKVHKQKQKELEEKYNEEMKRKEDKQRLKQAAEALGAEVESTPLVGTADGAHFGNLNVYEYRRNKIYFTSVPYLVRLLAFICSGFRTFEW